MNLPEPPDVDLPLASVLLVVGSQFKLEFAIEAKLILDPLFPVAFLNFWVDQ